MRKFDRTAIGSLQPPVLVEMFVRKFDRTAIGSPQPPPGGGLQLPYGRCRPSARQRAGLSTRLLWLGCRLFLRPESTSQEVGRLQPPAAEQFVTELACSAGRGPIKDTSPCAYLILNAEFAAPERNRSGPQLRSAVGCSSRP